MSDWRRDSTKGKSMTIDINNIGDVAGNELVIYAQILDITSSIVSLEMRIRRLSGDGVMPQDETTSAIASRKYD